MDGLTGAVQERMIAESKTKSGHMMLNMNLFSIGYLAVGVYQTLMCCKEYQSSLFLWHVQEMRSTGLDIFSKEPKNGIPLFKLIIMSM